VGHWEGTVQLPDDPLEFSVDFTRGKSGEVVGTIDIPRERIEGLPLSTLSVDGTSIKFAARADQPLTGVLASDGRSMSGKYEILGFDVPFKMTRTGDARVTGPLTSPPIGKALEGTWNGVLSAGGGALRVALTLLNQPDGTATGTMAVIDQAGLRVPVSIRQDGTGVALDLKAVGATFSGTLTGSELTGTYQQGPTTVPLTFRRAEARAR
jgi:hypothetical protein